MLDAIQGPERILGEECGERKRIGKGCAEFVRIPSEALKEERKTIVITRDTREVREKLDRFSVEFGVNSKCYAWPVICI